MLYGWAFVVVVERKEVGLLIYLSGLYVGGFGIHVIVVGDLLDSEITFHRRIGGTEAFSNMKKKRIVERQDT